MATPLGFKAKQKILRKTSDYSDCLNVAVRQWN